MAFLSQVRTMVAFVSMSTDTISANMFNNAISGIIAPGIRLISAPLGTISNDSVLIIEDSTLNLSTTNYLSVNGGFKRPQ